MSRADSAELKWVAWLPRSLRRRLEGSPALQKIGGNASWLVLERLVTMVTRFLVGVWVVRYLGPEQFGVYSYAISFAALFSALPKLGLDGIIVRNLARGADPSRTLMTAVVLRLIAAVLTMGVVAGVIFSIRDEWLIQLAVLLVASQFVFQVTDVCDLWFQSQTQSRYVVYVRSGSVMLFSAGQIALVLLEASLIAFVLVLVAQAVLKGVGLVGMFLLKGPVGLRWRPSASEARDMLWDSWPLILAGVATYLFSKIDQVMLGQMSSIDTVGVYAAAVRTAELFDFLPLVLTTSLLPTLVQVHKRNRELFRTHLQLVFDVMILLWIGVSGLLTVFAPWIVRVLYGEAYAESGFILALYAWAQFGAYVGLTRSMYINVNNLFKLSLVFTVVGAVVNVFLNYVLIPQYQAMGATYATLVTQVVVAFVVNFFSKDTHAIGIMILKSLMLHKSCRRLIILCMDGE